MLLMTCLALALVSGFSWTPFGPGSGTAHAAPACSSKVDLCLSIQSDGNTWWIDLGGQHLQSGTYVQYSYTATSGGSFGMILVSSKNGSLSTTINGGPCPAGQANATASAVTAKGLVYSAGATAFPC
jgi:hypothetical protein